MEVVSNLHKKFLVDAEGGDTDLSVARQGGGKVHGAGALVPVSPDGVRHCGSMSVVSVPHRGDRHGQADVVPRELGAGLARGTRPIVVSAMTTPRRGLSAAGRKLGDGLRHMVCSFSSDFTNALRRSVNSGAIRGGCHWLLHPLMMTSMSERGGARPRDPLNKKLSAVPPHQCGVGPTAQATGSVCHFPS